MITFTTCSAMIWFGFCHQLSWIEFVVGTGYLGAYTLMVIFTDLFLPAFYPFEIAEGSYFCFLLHLVT